MEMSNHIGLIDLVNQVHLPRKNQNLIRGSVTFLRRKSIILRFTFQALQALYVVTKSDPLVVCGVILCLIILINHMNMCACV